MLLHLLQIHLIHQIVVLPNGADTLLGIGGRFPGSHGGRGGGLAKEDGFDLVHLRVGEKDGGVGEGRRYRGRRGRDVGVSLGEEVYKGGAVFVRGPFGVSLGVLESC